MKAADVMVIDVITVKPENEVQDVAALMLTHHISAVPVVDEKDALVGIVREGDLLRRDEAGTGHERNWWLKLLMSRESLAAEYLKEHARKVADVMTRRVDFDRANSSGVIARTRSDVGMVRGPALFSPGRRVDHADLGGVGLRQTSVLWGQTYEHVLVTWPMPAPRPWGLGCPRPAGRILGLPGPRRPRLRSLSPTGGLAAGPPSNT